MSRALDVNILLFASDSHSRHHAAATRFLSEITTDDETLYLAWITIMSYLRMATHPRIFATPLTTRDAQANITSLLAMPNIHCIGEVDGFWDAYTNLADDVPVRGNLVPDAHLATVLRQHGIRTIYTHDRDFLKFQFLKVVDPFAK